MKSQVLTTALVKFVASQFQLSFDSPHGPAHWMRVRKNGLELAVHTGADTRVVELFALFHDSCRYHDHGDPDHGPRGAILAESCFQKGMIDCDSEQLGLLQAACFGHTSQRDHPDKTIATCWDADRLDLPRVGITPVPHKLCTVAARSSKMIERAGKRATDWLEKQYL